MASIYIISSLIQQGLDTSLGYSIITMILQETWVVEQFHNSLRCSLKLVIQIFPPWSNHRYLTFLLRWFPLHAEIYLNPFKCFKLLPYRIYPHIYTQFIVGSSHEVEESPAHNYAQWTTYIIMYVSTKLVACSTLGLWTVFQSFSLEKICKCQTIQKSNDSKNPFARSFFMRSFLTWPKRRFHK